MKMNLVFVCFGIFHFVTCDTVVKVDSDKDCGGKYNLDESELRLEYHGARLNDCTFTVEETESEKSICVYFEKMDITSCETVVKLFGYHNKNSERVDFYTLTCESDELTEYCPSYVTELYITLKHSGPDTNDEVNMEFSCKSDSIYIYIAVCFTALTIVIVIIPIVIVLRYRYKKRKVALEQNRHCKQGVRIETIDTRVTVLDSECGRTYSPSDGDLYLIYHGNTLSGCTIILDTEDVGTKVCAYFEKLDISSCSTTIEFYTYVRSKSSRRNERRSLETFLCTSEHVTKNCEPLVTKLHVDIKHPGQKTSDEVKIRFTYEDDSTYLYIVIPFAVAGGAFLIVFVVCAIRIVRKKRKVAKTSNQSEPEVGVFTTLNENTT